MGKIEELSTPNGTVILSGSPDLRVVLVEDDPDLRTIICRLWEQVTLPEKPTLAITDDAEWAITFIAQAPRLTVLVTDVLMPKMNGRELARKVRARFPETAIAYLTVVEGAHLAGDDVDDTFRKTSPNLAQQLALLTPFLAMRRRLLLTNAHLRDRPLSLV